MGTKPNPELIDDENPEWTEEKFAQAQRISDLPASLQAKLGGRGPQKAPPKVSTTIRLSADVVQDIEQRTSLSSPKMGRPLNS